jgi:hypothetical protein
MFAVAALKKLLRARRVRRLRRWILSLDDASLLALIKDHRRMGLDDQDSDGLVQLAFKTYPEGHKEAIVNRIAEHLENAGGRLS